jgi:transcriptional regulator with XRE-family HTH domain
MKYQGLFVIIHDISLFSNINSMIFHYDFFIRMNGNFKENLRNELNYQGITVKELSSRTGIPIASLDCYLGSRATMPSVQAAVKIARVLQVPVEYLVIDENSGMKYPINKSGWEAREIIRWVEKLNTEQCRAILKLIKTFKHGDA